MRLRRAKAVPYPSYRLSNLQRSMRPPTRLRPISGITSWSPAKHASRSRRSHPATLAISWSPRWSPRRWMRQRHDPTSLRSALEDPALLGATISGGSWLSWHTLLLAAMGEPLTEEERAIFRGLTGGRQREPLQRVEELVVVAGRRGGKSRAISVLATYIAALCRHPALVPGETGVVLVCAPDQRQADIVFDFVEANFRSSPILNQLIESRTQRTLRLTNHIEIEVRASDYRRLRGPSYVCVIGDESAFFRPTRATSMSIPRSWPPSAPGSAPLLDSWR